MWTVIWIPVMRFIHTVTGRKTFYIKGFPYRGICGYPPAGIQCGLFCGTFLDGRAGKRTGISAFAGIFYLSRILSGFAAVNFVVQEKRDAVYIYQCDGPLPCQCAVRHTVCHLPGWNGAG